jgi:hypothetical protein
MSVISHAAPAVEAQTETLTPSLTEIEKITNEIVRAEIRMMRISTQLRECCRRPGKWKSWRVFAYKLADSCMTNAGMILIAASRYKYANNTSAAPRPYLKSGHIVNLTAASIMVGGTLLESALDRLSDSRLSKLRLGPKPSLDDFQMTRSDLDLLLERRSSMIRGYSNLSAAQKEILEVDGLILVDLKELAEQEFLDAYCDVARLRANRDLSNLTTLVGASSAGYLGSLNSLLSVANRSPKQTGVAGLGFITSGSTVMVSPLVTSLGSDLSRRRAQSRLSAFGVEAHDVSLAKLDQHCKYFGQVIAKADDADKRLLQALNARRSVYNLHNAILLARGEWRSDLRLRSRRDLAERLFFSTVVGGTNIARGSQLALAGFHYFDSPPDTFRLVASASTAYIAGTGMWTVDNLQGKFREELIQRKLKKATKLSVHARLLEDLEQLKMMEDQMSLY